MLTMDILTSLIILCIATSRLGIGGDCQHTFNVINFGAVGDGRTDDSNAFAKAWMALCATGGESSTLEIPKGKTFLLQPTKFQGPCKSKNVHIQVLGNILAPNPKIGKLCGTQCWLCFYNVQGLSIDGSGIINGNGQSWWNQVSGNILGPDSKLGKLCGTECWLCLYNVENLTIYGYGTINGNGRSWWSQGKNKCTLPRALNFHNCNHLKVKEISIVNTPRAHMAINGCNDVSISNIHIDSPENSPNTDGIDISSSTQISIFDSSIKSGDDCVAINGGSSYIYITSVACGPGHGISVGSLGRNGDEDNVEEVHVKYCNFTGTQNGARIKTCQGGKGYARKISFEHIKFIGSQNPIIIDQNYPGGSFKGSAVKVYNVTYTDMQGTSKSEIAIKLDCSEEGCFGIKLEGVNIRPADKSIKGTSAYCKNAHGSSGSSAPHVQCLQPV